MKLLYNIGMWIAPVIVWAGSLFSRKLKLFREGRKGLISLLRQRISESGAKNIVWFHCASVGEFEQARPIIEWYKGNAEGWKVLLTFFSPSGYELRKNYNGADWVFYLPIDTPSNAKAFIEAVKPKTVIFTKYDLWYNFIEQARLSGAKLYLISAIFRGDQIYFKWYGGFFRKMLRSFNYIFVQDSGSAKLLSAIGISEGVIVNGDTRFDRVEKIAGESKQFAVIEEFVKGSFSLVAGSSWQPDDALIAEVMKNFPKMKLVVAPHEIHKERIEELSEIYKEYGVVNYSEIREDVERELVSALPHSHFDGKRVLVIDCLGILSSLYRYADFAYIGGGFGAGIHNTLEAAVYGVPLAFGPKYKKFKEAKDLIAANGAVSVSNVSELYQILDSCVKEPLLRSQMGSRCREYVEHHIGASEQIIEVLNGCHSE